MTGERTIWLFRHGHANSRHKHADKIVSSSSRIVARRAGEKATKSVEQGGLGLDLSVMGISKSKRRTRQTALAMADHLPSVPELIEYGFLDEVDLGVYDPNLSRYDVMNRILQRRSLPEFFPIIGEMVLRKIYNIDERIEGCVTHGTKNVAVQTALQKRGVLGLSPPSYGNLTGVGITLIPQPTAEDPNAVHVLRAEVKNL